MISLMPDIKFNAFLRSAEMLFIFFLIFFIQRYIILRKCNKVFFCEKKVLNVQAYKILEYGVYQFLRFGDKVVDV